MGGPPSTSSLLEEALGGQGSLKSRSVNGKILSVQISGFVHKTNIVTNFSSYMSIYTQQKFRLGDSEENKCTNRKFVRSTNILKIVNCYLNEIISLDVLKDTECTIERC